MPRQALFLKRAALCGVLCLLCWTTGQPVHAGTALPPSPPLNGPTDPAELEAFFDAAIPAQLEEYDIPGAAVAVVVDGALFFAKGYGYANSETREPVVADKTLFHIGSITKLFTWTAIMQLVERGQLDLDDDVNTYLTALQFPDTYPEPITIRHLLTHTPGLEDRLSNLLRINRYDGIPLEEYVIKQQPARIMAPGQLIGYSNYGGALAGYIVQEITGIPYEQYIEEHVFAPLTMSHSSVRRPVAADLADDVSMGHIGGPGGVVPLVEYFPSAPMVGISATATDMAKFMIAHLQNGYYGGNRILQEATAQEMHRQQFTHDARLPGVTYGFVEWQRNDRRMLWHSGSTPLFQNVLLLLPDQNMGVYVAYNRKTGQTETGKLLREVFLDHYYPVPLAKVQPLADYQQRVTRFAGDYRESRWAHTTADKFVYMLTRYYEAIANPDGSLQFMGSTYVEVEPLVFREVDGQGLLLFREDARGRVTYGFYDYDPHKVFIKLAWHETLNFQLAILISCALIFVSAFFERPVKSAVNSATGHWEALRLVQWVGIINLLYPVGMFSIGLMKVITVLPDLSVLALVLLTALLASLAGGLIVAVLAWKNQYWDIGIRLHYTLVVLAALTLAVWLHAWNLLGVWQF